MPVVFTRLELTNWRNFKNVDIALSPRVFVAGPNASGKTNLLDAIRFLRDIAAPGGSLLRAVEERRGLKHIRSLHAGGNSNVVVSVDLTIDGPDDTWTYTLEISGSETKNKTMKIEREHVVHRGQTVLERPGPGDDDALVLSQTHLEQVSQNRRFRPLAEALASVVAVHIVPQVARTPARAEEFSRREAPGSDFIDQLARLPDSSQKRALRRIEKLLRSAVPRFSNLSVTRDKLGRPHLDASYAHWRRRGGLQNEQEFSDGTLRLVGVLWAIDTGTTPLLLEEPELSLHRDVVRQLPRLFGQAAARTGRQIIVSTHAEEMFSDTGIDSSEVILLEPSEHETKVVPGTQKAEIQAAVENRIPLGPIITGLTKPPEIERLAMPPGAES